MKFISLSPFIPSGKDMEAAKNFFQELGFSIIWDQGDYVGFENGVCKFILQRYDVKAFAENLMLSVNVSDVAGFRQDVLNKKLPEKYDIRISEIIQQPYGKEVNVIDAAGVCWHFIE